MKNLDVFAFFIALLLSAGITGLVRVYARRANLLDIPNDRSSHEIATPRGGGIAIVLTVFCLCIASWSVGAIESRIAIFVACAAILIGGLGLLDDLMSLRARTRLVVHFFAATLVLLVWLPDFVDLGMFVRITLAGGYLLALVWSLNLYNFMDGIDGLAGSEAIFFATSGIVLLNIVSPYNNWSLVLVITAGACAGFLFFNWPPAKIFMGDGGSGFLGFLLALISIDTVIQKELHLVPWLLLGGVFLTDSTVTLFRRALTGQRIGEAHRSHAYQRLTRRTGSHRSVTLMAILVNVFWLLPLSILSTLQPSIRWYLLILGWGPLVIFEVVTGAGKKEA